MKSTESKIYAVRHLADGALQVWAPVTVHMEALELFLASTDTAGKYSAHPIGAQLCVFNSVESFVVAVKQGSQWALTCRFFHKEDEET
ncbi:Hypothetical protein I5071_9510 [Sandaracinus amylolyticus]|nr:Hypothetical protein I5071_9510 [Sandaracinus amylolyticus]